ncbi:hypothetical protein [Usitatibacter palustris]|uniref:Uncharacterized protein n=1 Tax=Usitatibacter palustris TaxID=2732487 RepID=A0A6M4HAK3_9PROT|nr:hypothetical protein [Usitatibacter palustris]QJR15444.1 hypothetical protein DSM104440_02264 [Usitatibacter palustris]
MQWSRIPLTLATTFWTAIAIAHPGHDAPPVHAHDLEEVALIVGAIVLVALAGWRLHLFRRRKQKGRPGGRPS